MYLQDEAKCPYCNVDLNKIPKRKTRCKSCENDYYVRTDPISRHTFIVTEKECGKIDAIKAVLTSGEITIKEINKEKKVPVLSKLLKKEHVIKSDNDIVWGLLNKKIHLYMRTSDWKSMKMIYYAMSRFLHAEGKDPYKTEYEAQRCELMAYKKDGIKKVTINSVNDENTCEACKSLNGKTLTITSALKEMPIPPKECNKNSGFGLCRCMYLPEIDF